MPLEALNMPMHRCRKMLKVGGGGQFWQEFLVCVRLETSGKSTKTDFVASHS